MTGLHILIKALMLLVPHTRCSPLTDDPPSLCDPRKTAPCPPGHVCQQDANGDFRCLSDEMKRLDDYILHHEVLTYNTDYLHMLHMRHKRSLDSSVRFDLNAFNRKFSLRLKNDQSVFRPDFVLEFNGTIQKPDLSFIYSGEVIGKPGSAVSGGILKGVFIGSISIPSEQETYHVEQSNRFFQDNPVFHSVIYKESDMNFDPFRERRIREKKEAAHSDTCGYVSALKWMREVAESEVSVLNREEEDAKLVLNAILLLFATHVKAIKTIYNTTFETDDGKISYTGMTFNIKNTKIMTPSDCADIEKPSDCKDTDIRLCDLNIDANYFLQIISSQNHDGVCLAYSFTSRDFTGGILGLAWYGATDRASGGVCERFKEYQENKNRVWRSLNTGFITTTNYENEVPARVSQLIFAHEVGHSFGSPHDSGTECAPYETSAPARNQGNYIMYAGATMGNYPQNREFSKCSKDSIARFIHAVLNNRYGKYNCFEESKPVCGNGIVEPGEECDCGVYGPCEDPCCIARNTPGHTVFCKLTTDAQCSPSQGPCCESTCTFTPATPAKICRNEECYKEASCDGNQAHCPNPVEKQDGTFCKHHHLTCKTGDCVGSLCERFGWTQCFPTLVNSDDSGKACELGCTNGTLDDCILSSETEKIAKYPDFQTMLQERIDGMKETGSHGISITDRIGTITGYPCNNFKGFCDAFNKCRDIEIE